MCVLFVCSFLCVVFVCFVLVDLAWFVQGVCCFAFVVCLLYVFLLMGVFVVSFLFAFRVCVFDVLVFLCLKYDCCRCLFECFSCVFFCVVFVWCVFFVVYN